MITVDGKTHIKRYLAGFVPVIAQSIAFGIGGRAEGASDTSLQFEVGRTNIALTSYDFVNDKLIFKAPISENFGGMVYEVALYSTATNSEAGEYGSRMISTFDSDTEGWVDSSTGLPEVFTSVNSRIGGDSLSHTPALSTSKTSALREILLDFAGNSGADLFNFAYNVGNAFTSQLQVRFLTDASNYYTFSLGAQTAGYKFVTAAKSTATVTGTPNWATITEIQVTTTSAAGGASAIDFDGIRIEDTDTVNPNYVMVSRELLATPYSKQEGKVQDIEYALTVNV